jgi:2-desacetyl-2-hydroxyethyl bacteriochlorophyllide A dehydrogenase
MKAAYQLHNQIHVGELPDPVPGQGQVLVRTHSCGLCASDQHFLRSGEQMVELSREIGGPYSHVDLNRVIVPGHEYVGEIIDYGPRSSRPLKIGTRVTSLPAMFGADGRMDIVGISNECPGGFGEYMLLDETLLIEVPTALDDDTAAMTEPLAVGLEHARRGEPTKDDIPLVVGCGAIGLAVVAGLKLLGVAPIVAADFDASRRELAVAMGAHVAIDPRDLSPYGRLPDLGNMRATLVYECVGRRGLLDLITRSVGFGARIVMGGFCNEPESIFVPCAQMKRLQVIFAGGEEQEDLDKALRAIAEGTIDVAPWIGARINLNGVAHALNTMADIGAPVRTVVDPRKL